MKIVIVGGSAAGMFASLILARAGHEIILLEREILEVAPDVESAALSALRAGAPQIVQPHIVMARCRELLLEHLPDVYQGLLSAGVVEAPISTQMPASLLDRTSWPGDERLSVLMTRRSTIDWVLQRAILAEPAIKLLYGTRVTGVLAVPGERSRVTGVRTNQGDFASDLVVDATGYRSLIDHWLVQIGAAQTAVKRAECGLAYFSRHYRLRQGVKLPGLPETRIVAGLNEFTVGIWGSDNGTMQMAVVPLAMDHRFRTLKNPDVFTAVLSTIPTFAAWLNVLDPISDVFPMGGVHNTLRRFVGNDTPVITGLHAIGDSLCTTNPTFGRGLSLALSSVISLRKTIEQFGEDWTGQTLAFDEFVTQHIEPFYEDQARNDGARFATLRDTIFGNRSPDPLPVPSDQVSYSQLRTAAAFDPTAFRAFWKVLGMLEIPSDIYTDPQVVARTREGLLLHGSAPSISQPSREQLLAALAT